MDTDNRPVIVTVRTITYNHEPYLRDCLNGIVMQKTNFRFEAVVHDDCSTDHTADIIREYAAKYPDIIKPIYETENQYSKGKDSLTGKKMDALTHGKYIAICEGDDYWTDPNKLQMQVDFLESHPEYSMCFHDVDVKAEPGRNWYDVYGKLEDRDYDAFEDIWHWCVPTCSIVVRREVFEKRPCNDKFRMGDNVLVLTCGKYGKLRCIPRKMGTYRLTPTSWIGGQSNKQMRYKYISHYKGLIEEFESCRNEKMYGILENQYFQLLTILKIERDEEEFDRIKCDYLKSPGKPDFSKFIPYYRKESIRIIAKKILGHKISKLISKINSKCLKRCK